VNDRQLDLGVVTSVHVESFGEPGQRTFRVLADTAGGQISIWLEKEQVVMLGTAIEELLDRVPDHAGEEPAAASSESFRGELEVKAGSLSIGYDAQRVGFTLQAADFYETPFELSAISLLTDRSDFKRMAGEISEILAASRPRCLLCGAALTGEPHFCPESNGHSETHMPD
jgi:uncharacterized repeat protein (TIGR03847 family)